MGHKATVELCRIRRAYIHDRHSGRAWQPSPTRRFFASSTQAKVCQYRNPQSHFVRADTAVRPYAEDLERVARCCTAHPFCVGEILSISQAVTIPAEQRDARWNVERVGRKPKA